MQDRHPCRGRLLPKRRNPSYGVTSDGRVEVVGRFRKTSESPREHVQRDRVRKCMARFIRSLRHQSSHGSFERSQLPSVSLWGVGATHRPARCSQTRSASGVTAVGRRSTGREAGLVMMMTSALRVRSLTAVFAARASGSSEIAHCESADTRVNFDAPSST